MGHMVGMLDGKSDAIEVSPKEWEALKRIFEETLPFYLTAIRCAL